MSQWNDWVLKKIYEKINLGNREDQWECNLLRKSQRFKLPWICREQEWVLKNQEMQFS